MKLPTFTSLPCSLLFSSLLLVAALPVDSAVTELRQLTSTSFSSTTQHGLWFIEFFSPWCHHCREFFPTWERLVEHIQSQSDPGISLARVNCIAQGDLCDEKKVGGYPSLKLYEDGKEVEEFNDTRDFDVLTKYIAKHTRRTQLSNAGPSPNPDGAVVPLDKNSFSGTIAQGPTFVKFFAPWCGHCKKLAPTWVQFAARMKNKVTVAEVNCEEHSGLCSNQKITGYPMLFLYQHGRTVDYTGRRTLEALESFADTVLAPPLKSIPSSDLLPILENEEVVYLVIHDTLRLDIKNRIEEAAQPLHGTPRLYSIQSSSKLLSSLSIPNPQELPALVVLKDHSMIPFHKLVLSSNAPISQMSDWLLMHSLPISTELDADNFNRVMGPSPLPPATPSRLVVLVAVNRHMQTHIDLVKEVGTIWNRGPHANEGKSVVFVWMDRDKWASWLKDAYGIKASVEPAVVIVDHGRLLYYDLSIEGEPIRLEASSIFSTLDDVSNGVIEPKYSENVAERLGRWIRGWVLSLQSTFLQHPIWSMSLLCILLFGVYLGAKRVLETDMRSSAAYANAKLGSRLD